MNKQHIEMVDAHFHLDLYPEPHVLIRDIESKSVKVIAVTNAPSVFQHCYRMAINTAHVYVALGLHPELVKSHSSELSLLHRLLPLTRFIGEIGLDYTTTIKSERRLQQDVLNQILKWCADYKDKIITLHSRRASADLMAMVGNDYPGKIVLHWFSGTAKQLSTAQSYGYYFSINPAMISSKSGQMLISQINKEKVLTETDGPFIRTDSGLIMPWDTIKVIEYLSVLWNSSIDETINQIMVNFNKLINT